ncbi:acetylornithine transaminase [Brevibacillus massiliensis]|uniref:acetylornithine transaminase n=1 Tax=Brevibacillus massiliensis TaxID=1118054 RepID=UPI000318E83E|nr:acetylornithine transaminase [Brevibacillus massiliensis]
METTEQTFSLMNNYSRWPVRLVRGQGNTVWDEAGRSYLDFTSGIAVASLGHVPPRVAKRLHEQVDTLWHTSNLFEHPLQERVADALTRLSGLDRAFFCNSGAEANEGAIKLARRYAQKVKGTERYEIITFQQSFHGRTLATLTATGQDKVKDGFAPLPPGFKTIPYNDSEALRAAISDKTCGILLELVQGEGGVHAADPEWVKEIRQLCDQHGLLMLVDEVQTGIGRTGEWFAFQHYGIKPDVISLAKALGSGFPVGAVLATEQAAEAFAPGSHGTTFGGNPLAMAAALATLETIEQENLLARVRELSGELEKRLKQIQQQLPEQVTSVRGKGLLLGVELARPAADVITYAREKGLLILSAGPQVIRLLPSFITTEEEIAHACEVLAEAIQHQ